MNWELIIFLCWIVVGIFNYGLTFGYFQNNWPTVANLQRREDMLVALFYGILGPLALFAFLICLDHKPRLRIKDIKFW